MLIIQFHLQLSVNERCQKAVNDVKIVTSCPKSKEEWDIAALKKNCSKLAAVAKTKNCTIKEKQPEYHCVFNSLRNKLLEVCADKRIIFGYCTEFNEFGGLIQNHYPVPCEKVSPKCIGSYYSSDAYKYQGCYELVKQTQNSTDLDPGNPKLGNEKRFSFSITITVTFASILLCGLAVTIVLFCKRRSELPKKEIDKEEHQRLMDDKRIDKEAESKPCRQYLYCKAEEFEHFRFIYDQIWEYKQRLDNENKKDDLPFVMPKNVVVRIELVGQFTNDDLQLLPRGKLSKKEKKDESIWEAILLVCFQNDDSLKSALEARREESACHVILIKSVLDATDNKDGSIRVVDQNKENILNTMTSYLEKPLGAILQKWSDIYTDRVDEIMAFKKTILDHNKDIETPNVADNKGKCLSRKPDKVNDTKTKNISRRGQVNKETDDKELRTNFINSESFEKYPLKQEKIKLLWSLSGRVVKKTNDESDTFAPTDRQEITKRNQTTCTEDRDLPNQRDFSVTKLTMNQTEDNQNGDKSVGVDGIRYSNPEHEVRTTWHHSTSSVTSTENSDESNDLDFDNSLRFKYLSD